MSWLDNIKEGIIITTGDGQIHTPDYVIQERTTEFNISEFEYPNIEGTDVNRGTAKGTRHNLDIIFQGEDHLDTALDFEKSTKDRRPWNISHPFYGFLVVQPISLTYDSTGLNVTRITGIVVETITEVAPRSTVDPIDKINTDADESNQLISAAFGNKADLEASDINSMTVKTASLFEKGSSAVRSGDQANEYFNLFNEAQAAISNAIDEPSVAATKINALIVFPSIFIDSVNNRLKLFKSQIDDLSSDLNISDSVSSKQIFELNTSSIINASLVASINPLETDYQSAVEVFESVDLVVDLYNNFIISLDILQTSTGADTDSYIPDFDSLLNLTNLVNFTVSQLFIIALNARQERTLLLEADSNAIVLAHRFYGSDIDDTTLDEFMNQNNIGLSEVLEIKKDRRLVFYV